MMHVVRRAAVRGLVRKAAIGAAAQKREMSMVGAASAVKAKSWSMRKVGGARWCTTISCPVIAESISEGTVGPWEVAVGDSVLEDAVLGGIESEKVTVAIRAPHDGIVTEIIVEEGVTVNVGQPIIKIKEAAVPSGDAPKKTEEATPAPAAAAAPEKPQQPQQKAPQQPKQPQQQQQVFAASTDREKRVRLTAMRKRIADRLKASQNTAAMLTTFQEVDMSNLINLRNEHKQEFFEKHGVKLGFMSAFVKASASALQAVPIINAYMDLENDCIVYHDYVDISVAVAIPTGLVVPVLRDVQDMNFADIEKQIGHFAQKAKDGNLTLPEMSGGTFTISNGGTYGSWMGTPIINPPQSAVLGMHAVRQKAWVDKNGHISARPIMALALTYDHRLIDGRDAVTFLVKVKNLIEDPHRLILDLA
eukprot:TRINITY_DN4895_c0_g1_i1.p1 TRINITY_DN4895_c0_g1~~TRINITY_DN4895_c0_g1_i1.p1  ORF type:complete len:419 (+),score=182.89 TRINITY_DN4895_c0_g1_i1:49-1305(+)